MNSFFFIFSLFSLTFGIPPLQVELDRGFPFHSNDERGGDLIGSQRSFNKAFLPANNVIPLHYIVHLTPIIDEVIGYEQYSIPGTVTITVTPVVNIRIITLNALDLDIDATSITVIPEDPNDDTTYVVTGRVEVENEFYVLDLDQDLQVEKNYRVFIKFTSYIATTKLNGIYLTGYQDPETNQFENVLTTQFEASAARQAFPCFDEPRIKATFKIYIGYDVEKYIALCNAEAIAEVQHPEMPSGWVLKEFQDSVKMSAYLIAIVIAKYTYVEAPQEIFSKPVRIYGPPHLIDGQNGGDYSATKAAEFLAFFETYYGIEYQMGKMDSVAVPAFWFGAMENWGLNFYRETLLMYFDGISTETERKATSHVLAHELTHQWFGNLVTAQYWDQIWLNEGFAKYYEYIATAVVAPEFNSLTIRQFEVFQAALKFDATENSHPLINSAHGNQSYDTLMEVFDMIAYEKASSLIRMMEGFLGPDTMKNGLVDYLTILSYEAASQDDLFNILTQRGHSDGTFPLSRTVKDVMDTWSFQSGFPLLRVVKSSNSRFFVSQERFVDNVKYSNESTLNTTELWVIPVAIATANNPDFTDLKPDFWIEKNEVVKVVDDIDTTKWVLVNADATGYFRVLYDESLFQLLVNQLDANSSIISVISRSQLFDDYFTFWNHKLTELENPLRLTKYLGSETEIGVWTTVFSYVREIMNKISGTSTYEAFQIYFLPRFDEALTLIGLEQLPEDIGKQVILRSLLLDWACSLGHSGCREYASVLFDQWESSPVTNPVPVDIRAVVYCGAVAHGGVETFTTALNRYSDAQTSAKDKPLFLNSLGCASNESLPLALLPNLLLEESEIAATDKIAYLQRLGANSESRQETTNYIQQSAVQIINVLGTRAIVNYIATLTTYVGSEEEFEQLQAIITENEVDLEAERPILDAHLQTIQTNVQWRKENEARLEIWFSEN